MDKAGQDFHQRRFARAILAQQTVNRPGFDGERDVIVRVNRAKVFVDVSEFKVPC